MENYKIIKDEKLLLEFIEWLPDLKESEQYYCCLFARSKYTKDENGVNGLPHIKSDKAQLRRFTSTKERLLEKIQQLEIPLGRWKQRGNPVPEEALALYITPNPRDLWKATSNSLVKLAKCIRDSNKLNNPHQEILSEIQKSKGTTHYVDFDIDEDDSEKLDTIIKQIKESVNPEALTWIKTRGGVHCLVSPNKVGFKYDKTWYKNISWFADQKGDTMIPVVGVTQGGFTPHFWNP